MPQRHTSAASRREFLQTAAAAAIAGTALLHTSPANGQFGDMIVSTKPWQVACNQYSCTSILSRDGIDFLKDIDKSLDLMKNAEIDGLEPMISSPSDIDRFAAPLKSREMAMETIYVGANLHEADKAEAEIARLVAIAEKAAAAGTAFIVFNPAAKPGKSDDELIRQAENTNKLGEMLSQYNIALAFHYHTTELEFGGREFYHLLQRTTPGTMQLCFEMHWSYRACGNSTLPVYDHLEMFADRVAVIHLRQSKGGVWTETFGEGDIDVKRIAQMLGNTEKLHSTKQLVDKVPSTFEPPTLVLEQASENGTSRDLSATEVFRQSVAFIRKTFTPTSPKTSFGLNHSEP